MCGEKQSVKKVYGKGTGKECRLHVQTLNEQRMLNESVDQNIEECEEIYNIYTDDQQIPCFKNDNNWTPKTSKWGEYLVEEKKTADDDVCEDDGKFTFDRPKKRKSFQRNNGKQGKKFKPSKMQENHENFEEFSEESTKIDTNSLSKKKISTSMEESSSTSKNINSIWTSFLSHDNMDADRVSSSSNTTTTKQINNIDVPKPTQSKKSKWDSYITETECENEISSQEINIFNSGVDYENLDDILDI